MTQDESIIKEAREKIAEFLWEKEKNISLGWDYLKYLSFEKLPKNTRDCFLHDADQILSLKGDNWQFSITEILSDLPSYNYDRTGHERPASEIVTQMIEEMNFKRVIYPKEGGG